MSNIKVKKPVSLKPHLMLALLPALAAGWLAMHLGPNQKAQADAQERATLVAEAAEYRCLKAAGLKPDGRNRAYTREEAAALATCRVK